MQIQERWFEFWYFSSIQIIAGSAPIESWGTSPQHNLGWIPRDEFIFILEGDFIFINLGKLLTKWKKSGFSVRTYGTATLILKRIQITSVNALNEFNRLIL